MARARDQCGLLTIISVDYLLSLLIIYSLPSVLIIYFVLWQVRADPAGGETWHDWGEVEKADGNLERATL